MPLCENPVRASFFTINSISLLKTIQHQPSINSNYSLGTDMTRQEKIWRISGNWFLRRVGYPTEEILDKTEFSLGHTLP